MLDIYLSMGGIVIFFMGFLISITSMMKFPTFGEVEDINKKNIEIIIGIILIIIGVTIGSIGVIMSEERLDKEMNEICESIDMEFTKKAGGGLFSNSYVICYDNINKQIREIPL
jgi:hypothetical protein